MTTKELERANLYAQKIEELRKRLATLNQLAGEKPGEHKMTVAYHGYNTKVPEGSQQQIMDIVLMGVTAELDAYEKAFKAL